MLRRRLPRGADGLLALAVAGAVALIIVPLPPPLIDLLLSVQLGCAVVILLVALGAQRPLELSTFPLVLLLATLFRLALNISTTRLILGDADGGQVIEAFGDAVVGGALLVGVVIFALITIVQYLVVARGAERVAQVAARFALDGLPGRQLAIDADVRAGLLDPEAARTRREQLARESGLYGAMDGTMKFVRGDAIAGMIIVAVNAVGGLIIGMGQRGMSLDEALGVYTVLTVGDGLVTQLPSVLTATAAAVVATRVATPDTPRLGQAIFAQLLGDGRAGTVTGLLLCGLALMPGLPTLPLLLVGAAAITASFMWAQGGSTPRTSVDGDASEGVVPVAIVFHPIATDALAEHQSQAVIERARRILSDEYGLTLPDVDHRSNAHDLSPGTYRIEVGEVPVAWGNLVPSHIFASPAPANEGGEKAPHPRTGAPGRWLPSGAGMTPDEYLAQHLVACWRRQGPPALGVQAVADRVTAVASRAPALVSAVIPRRLTVPRLAWLLRSLVAEDIPIRNLEAILEYLSQQDPAIATDPERLEALRRAMAAQITARVAPEGYVEALYPDAELERTLRNGGRIRDDELRDLMSDIMEVLAHRPRACLVVPEHLRAQFRAILAGGLPGLSVIAGSELLPQVKTVTVGLVGVD